MNILLGQVCPYCKSELTNADEVVFCSECKMPHHKICWIENKGCTTFGCQGTIDLTPYNKEDYIDLTSECFESEICESIIDNTSSQKLYENDYSKKTKDISNISIFSSSTCNSSKSAHNKIDNSVGWNWFSFLFCQYWLVYNKLYLYGMAVYIVNLIIIILKPTLFLSFAISIHTILGFTGNLLYNRHTKKIKMSITNVIEKDRIIIIVCLSVIQIIILCRTILLI